MSILINYVHAMETIIELDESVAGTETAREHLQFMTAQQAVAVDSDLDKRILFVTYACQLNEFLYENHPVIRGVPLAANWTFFTGTALCNCLPYALMFWTNQLAQFIQKDLQRTVFPPEASLALHANVERVQITTLDPALVEMQCRRVKQLCGVLIYVVGIVTDRHLEFVKEQMSQQWYELQKFHQLFDLIFGWLGMGRLYTSYMQSKQRPEKTNRALYQYAMSAERRCRPTEQQSFMETVMYRDAKALMCTAQGYHAFYAGNTTQAARLWKAAILLGANLREPEQADAFQVVRLESEQQHRQLTTNTTTGIGTAAAAAMAAKQEEQEEDQQGVVVLPATDIEILDRFTRSGVNPLKVNSPQYRLKSKTQ